MPFVEWHEAIDQIEPHIFRITTPDGAGSGFLVSKSTTGPLCVVATAAHVVQHADYWEQPIRLHHMETGTTTLLRPVDRKINIDSRTDTAGILFLAKDLQLPETGLPLMKKDSHLKPGVEIGWLGFPSVSPMTLCFFCGYVSAYFESDNAYLVDGVVINGVSGGPAFWRVVDSAEFIGVVSAYIPNRATGEVLPGVAVVRDVNRYHHLAERLRSLDEAQAQQTEPGVPPPPQSGGEQEGAAEAPPNTPLQPTDPGG